MATANYKLELGPLIDTVFVIEIGGHFIDPDSHSGTIDNVFISSAGIRIRIELGGIIMQQWKLVVTIDDDGTVLKTMPAEIFGRIGPGGGSAFDRNCPVLEA